MFLHNIYSGLKGRLFVLPMLAICLGACEPATPKQSAGPQYAETQQNSDVRIYRFAIHPLHNPQKLTTDYQPLIEYLDKNIPNARFRVEASRDYQSYELKIRDREAEFLLPNPWQTLEAMKVHYKVIAMAGDEKDFQGIFIVRKDSNVKKPADLKGKAVSYPSPTALAAAIMPQYYLHTNGINVNRDIENKYVGSQESSIMNVFLNKSAAGATWPPPWRAFQKDHPREADQLKVIWKTPTLMNNSFMARDDVPADVRERVTRLLIDLQNTDDGRKILAGMETARFNPANDASYEKVRIFINKFEKEVRSVESKP